MTHRMLAKSRSTPISERLSPLRYAMLLLKNLPRLLRLPEVWEKRVLSSAHA